MVPWPERPPDTEHDRFHQELYGRIKNMVIDQKSNAIVIKHYFCEKSSAIVEVLIIKQMFHFLKTSI